MTKKPRPIRGAISAQEVYPLQVFLNRLGIGRSTYISWRQAGLPMHHAGKRVFLFGDEAIEFLRTYWNEGTAE